jgi:hypothetical protein
VLGELGEPLHRIEPARFLVVSLLIAALPAAQAAVSGLTLAERWMGSAWRARLLACGLLLTGGVLFCEPVGRLAWRWVHRQPFPIGLPADVQTTVALLRRQTTTDARILWEEEPDTEEWTPLLPLLTGRSYLGGLGSDAPIEHAAHRFAAGRLAGRPLTAWTDADLADFCRQYNVGWIVCQSRAGMERVQAWSGTAATAPLPVGQLFTVNRPLSYFLVGQGQVIRCDSRLLTLADLEPVDGQVVISFHHHPRIVPSTDRVRIEKEPQLYDAIPFIRLRLPGPMARLTLYWQE